MPCCGRGSLTDLGSSPLAPVPRAPRQEARNEGPMRQSHLIFEYFGRSGLTAIGGVTGKRYRFDRPGARIAVEPVDKPSLVSVPHLRRVIG